MYLFDRVNELCGVDADPTKLRKAFDLPAIDESAIRDLVREMAWLQVRVGRLAAARRYALAPDTIRAAVSVLSSRPASLLSCLEVLRIPWRETWIEWDENVRIEALREVSPESWQTFQNRPVIEPRKLALHIEADETGRSGAFRVAWPVPLGLGAKADKREMIVVSGGDVRFDFDKCGQFAICMQRHVGSSPIYADLNNLVEQTTIALGAAPTAVNVEAVGAMLSHFQPIYDPHAISRCIEAGTARAPDELMTLQDIEDAGFEQIRQTAHDVIAEIMPFLALMMLLTAVGGTQMVASDLVKVNRSRAKRGAPALLEHEVVHVRLDRAQRSAVLSSRGAGAGTMRRPHIVGGHFVRRSGKIFWRRSHVRGVAAGVLPREKTYLVSGSRPVEAVVTELSPP